MLQMACVKRAFKMYQEAITANYMVLRPATNVESADRTSAFGPQIVKQQVPPYLFKELFVFSACSFYCKFGAENIA